MKEIKLYNVLFPVWLILFFPPVIFITLFGNFIIDSLVVIAVFALFRMKTYQLDFRSFYKKSIVKVWLLGFAADLAGAVVMFVTGISGDSLGLPHEITSGVNYDPFSHPGALAIVIFAMLLSGFLVYVFNYYITFARLIENERLRFKTAMTIAVITVPWTFLVPSKWFY